MAIAEEQQQQQQQKSPSDRKVWNFFKRPFRHSNTTPSSSSSSSASHNASPPHANNNYSANHSTVSNNNNSNIINMNNISNNHHHVEGSTNKPGRFFQLYFPSNELNPEVILAAQIVLGLFVLISTLLLAFPRFKKVYLVLKLLFEAVHTLVKIVVLLQQLIWDLHQIISMAHDGFQQVVSVLKLIDDVVRSLVSLADLLRRLIRTGRGIWAIWTARQPAAVANEPQNEVPPTDAEADTANGQNDVMMNEESNI